MRDLGNDPDLPARLAQMIHCFAHQRIAESVHFSYPQPPMADNRANDKKPLKMIDPSKEHAAKRSSHHSPRTPNTNR
jgi:hypothetical protein